VTEQFSRVPSDLAGSDSAGRGLRVLYRRRLAHQPVNWHLRSMADADTHRGELRPDGLVLAFDRAGPCSYPPDAGQVCPAYARAAR
jgi:hypothetical protein